MHGGGHGDGGIQHPFGRFLAVQQHRIGGHQVADVAHQHQRAARMGHRLALRVEEFDIRVQAAGHGLAALLEAFFQIAAHQAQPIGIDHAFVLGIHGRHRILAILDRGQRAFQANIGNPGRVVLADGRGAVDHHLDQQAIGPQEDVAALGVARELRRVGQRGLFPAGRDQQRTVGHLQRLDIGPGPFCKRHDAVHVGASPADHLGAALRIIARPFGFALDRVGAVKRIVKRAPARIGRVQRETRVHHRHDQLRAGHAGDLGVHVLGGDREGLGFGFQVSDLGQEIAISLGIERLALPGLVPFVDLALHLRALVQQPGIDRGQVAQQRGIARPEGIGRDIQQDFIFDQLGQGLCHRQALAIYVSGHLHPPFL